MGWKGEPGVLRERSGSFMTFRRLFISDVILQHFDSILQLVTLRHDVVH